MTAIREGRRDDLDAIVALLADDELGLTREDASPRAMDAYANAFDAMLRQDGNRVLVAVEGDAVLGCLQLTIIPGLSRRGTCRAQIEGVRVAHAARGKGIGELLLKDAIARARAAGCGLVQLTTDKARGDAHRFYLRHGFVASHEGMKLALD
jgi:GNAT superfamily N-acetyltransferase